MTTNLDTRTEADAALDEGLAPITAEADALRIKWLTLKAQANLIEDQLKDIRDELGATLVEGGLQGMTSNGKVVVRLSEVTTQKLDTAALKAKDPELYLKLMARFVSVTKSERMNITK